MEHFTSTFFVSNNTEQRPAISRDKNLTYKSITENKWAKQQLSCPFACGH